ncbi:MAG: alpha/beta hydrolase [Lachnospiraceae bacterium]|nr:alpha/beta hydrolase [Lachnospiraceae bacterium]
MRERRKSIYWNEESKNAVWELYDRQLEDLKIPYKNLYIDTLFGKTHLVECGNLEGKPLLVFHGGNATTAYNLKYCEFLLHDFHIFAVDTIGHPGKSAEVSLSPHNQDYGKWAVDVIKGLGFDKMACFGGSFGAGILVKAMCAAPDVIERSILLVPSAIKNAPAYKSINMVFPMLMFLLTHKERWFVRCILPMAVTESNITEDILITARCSIENAKIKSVMPQNEKCKNLSKYHNPVFVMAAEKDCLFPAAKVLPQAEKVWKQSIRYLMKGRGHINQLTNEEKKMIVEFLSD